MKFQNKIKLNLLLNLVLIVVTVFSIQIWTDYLFHKNFHFKEIDTSVKTLIGRIQSDISYKDGKWDISKYTSDPDTPNPHGSSGFTNPLYIVTNEGLVIERNNPIGGLLDSSDYKHLVQFSNPRYVSEITSENWRVYSRTLNHNNQNIGVIFVAHYNPSQTDAESIDRDLKSSADSIESSIRYNGDNIDTSAIDIRNIPFDISFEVVNNFNKVIANNGRTPSYIDPSYIHDQLKSNVQIIKDVNTNEPYYVRTQTISSDDNQPVGIIVSGFSLKSLYSELKNYLIFASAVSLLLLIPLIFVLYVFINGKNKNNDILLENKPLPKTIQFDKKLSKVIIDNNKVDIPYDSNQYYLCSALFSKPSKRWEQDELLEVMGIESKQENNRKIYDAALAINKKLATKLITYSGKTYQINPELVPSIS